VAGGGGASVSARSVRDAASGQAPAAFPPADTAAVLAVCPDAPLLPDALGTAGNMDTAGLPTQGELDAAAGQVRAAGGEEGGGVVRFFSLFRNSPAGAPLSTSPRLLFFLPPPLAQISACVSALRADPDALACYYPCDYSVWRAAALAPPRAGLAASPALTAAAARHASDMAATATFAHAGSDNSTVASRIADAGFDTFPLGENIAAGYASVRAVSVAWACSAGHRANLLACGFDAIGTGASAALGTPYTVYYSQEFGCTRPDYACTCPPG
jgi:hypothetical protein